MAAIDIGPVASDRGSTLGDGYTSIALDNPANDTGTITSVEIFVVTGANLEGCKVGTFYGSSTNYTSRDSHTIGNVTGGSKQTFSGLDIDVTSGDFIGSYFSAGNLERDTSGAAGLYYKSGDQFGQGQQTYTLLAGHTTSVYGAGATPAVAPTVTTQAVSSIGTTTATGNGNITDTGGEDASAWGTCLATTANPDTGDTVDAGSGSGGTGAFTTSIGGLVSPAKYHVRAYATNTAGTSYGADVTFITLMTASVIVGNLVTASRAITVTRSASVIVGNLVSATKSWGRTRSASVIVGVVASASKVFGSVKTASVIVGVVATATRVAGITRTASTIIGVVPSASRLIAAIRTATPQIGVVASASRSVTYTRASSVIIGIIATGKAFWAYVKLSLKKRVVNFTLPDRTTDFTLPKRITDFTLRSREDGD